MTTPRVVVYTDGASRGNPGKSAIGVSVVDPSTGAELTSISRAMESQMTNNEAEYLALMAGLDAAAAMGARHVEVRLDSQLVQMQMLGRYKVTKEHLRGLREEARKLAEPFASVVYTHVPREQNKRADQLANQALDGGESEAR